jgi:hypothetical protein
MLKRIVLGALAAMAVASAGGCGFKGKAGAMDTTKDVYKDDEVPAVFVSVVNGKVEETPWKEVPESARWLFERDDSGGYKYRVPIVREETISLDRQGHPVAPKDAYRLEWTSYGLNPKYMRHSYGGHDH